MTGKTHLMGGIAAALITVHTVEYDPIVYTAAAAAGSLLPDICHTGSKMGRKFKLLSRTIITIFGHRTITHSVLFLLLVNLCLPYITSSGAIRIGLLVGMASHLLLDAMTKKGIKLFYPLPLTVRFPLTMKTGDKGEALVLAGLSLLSLYYAKDLLLYYL